IAGRLPVDGRVLADAEPLPRHRIDVRNDGRDRVTLGLLRGGLERDLCPLGTFGEVGAEVAGNPELHAREARAFEAPLVDAIPHVEAAVVLHTLVAMAARDRAEVARTEHRATARLDDGGIEEPGRCGPGLWRGGWLALRGGVQACIQPADD